MSLKPTARYARTMTQINTFPGALLAALALAACGGGAPQAPPPPEVGVVVVQPRTINNITEAPGRVQAVRRAEVRARVDGIVQRRLYDEGSDVAAGQELFLIDPRELRAARSAAEAALVRAQATAANAAQDVERYRGWSRIRRSANRSTTPRSHASARLKQTSRRRERSSRARGSISGTAR